MCDVKRNSGLALLVAGAIGSGDGLFLCIMLLVCREEGRPGPGTSPPTPASSLPDLPLKRQALGPEKEYVRGEEDGSSGTQVA